MVSFCAYRDSQQSFVTVSYLSMQSSDQISLTLLCYPNLNIFCITEIEHSLFIDIANNRQAMAKVFIHLSILNIFIHFSKSNALMMLGFCCMLIKALPHMKLNFQNKLCKIGKDKIWSYSRKYFKLKIWHKIGEAFLPKNTVLIFKHWGSLMMFWDCFSSRGTGQLIAKRGIMKWEDYIKILD